VLYSVRLGHVAAPGAMLNLMDVPARRLLLLLYAVPALWLVHQGLIGGGIVGLPWGEAWGRLYVTGQVGRWFGGTPVGQADLVAFPGGRPFWPVDPIVQLVALPLEAIAGEAAAWALVLAGLFVVAGVGGYAAARSTGAPAVPAGIVGLMLLWNPFLLRHAAEGVTEVLSIGFVGLAVAAGARVRGREGLGLYALACAGVAGTSPYYAVYGALALLISLPLWPADRRRDALVLLGILGAVGVVFAVPIALTESGQGGRVSAAWTGGYRLLPEPLVVLGSDGGISSARPGSPPGGDPGMASQSILQRSLVQWPGGVAVTATLIAGTLHPDSRKPAALGLLWLILGPAWAVVGRWIGFPEAMSPIQHALLALPGTSLLGNANRQVVVPIVLAAIAAGPVLARWSRAAIPLAALVLLAAILETPPLSLPAVGAQAGPIPSIDGPTITFPSGDPPLWNPGPWPKEGLWRAKHHGGAQAYDYGRGGIPSDAPALVRLSQVARVPLGRRAAETMRPADDASLWADVRDLGFTRILVVRRTLEADSYAALRGYLVYLAGPPLSEDDEIAVWNVPSGAPEGAP
jgi:hypothetical protein